MSARRIDGKAIAADLRAGVALAVDEIEETHRFVPGLAVVLVGDDPASQVYVGAKHKATLEVGMRSLEHRLPADTAEAALLDLYRGVALRRTAPGAPASLAALLKRAKADQARGLVLHLGTFETGIASIAAPIRIGGGEVVAAINLSAALEEAESVSRRESVAASLLQATVQIARRLGQMPP